MKITDKVMQKGCAIDLATQLIKNLNAKSKIAIKVNKLLNKDQDNIRISKDEKKVLQKRLTLYVKTVKANTKYHVNCLEQIKQTQNINNHNRFY